MATQDYAAQLLELLKQNPSLAGDGGNGWYFGAPEIRRPGDFMQSLGDTGDLYAQDYSLQGLEGLKGGATIDPRTGMVSIGGQTMSADDFAKRYRTAGRETTGETGIGATDWQNFLVDTQNGGIAGREDYNTPGFSVMNDLILPAAAIWGGGALLGGALGGAGAGLGGAEAALGNGAFLGEGVASGIGAWDAALANAAAGGAGLGGADQVIKTMGQGAPSVDVGAISSQSALPTGLGASLPGAAQTVGQLAGAGGGLLGGAGSILDGLGGMKGVLPIVGGLIGASEGGKPNTATSQSKTDPRLDQYLYGSGYGDQNSLLGAAQSLWQQNKSGMNPTMQAGLDMQKSALMDPAYGQSYQNMRNAGNSLLSSGAAGNPFTTGQMRPPTMQAGGPGGLLGGMDIQSLIRQGRGLIG